ncbi:hypothetical protein Tco_1184226 [Tanacetum coccineum]
MDAIPPRLSPPYTSRPTSITAAMAQPLSPSPSLCWNGFSVRARLDAATPPPTNLLCRIDMGIGQPWIRIRDRTSAEEVMPPRGRSVITAPPLGCDIAESSAAAAARAPRELQTEQKKEDVGYARALQASEHRMMTSIEEVNLRVSYQVQARKRESEDFYTQLLDAQTDRRDIRLEIDVVRGQRTAYEIELWRCTPAYLRWRPSEPGGQYCAGLETPTGRLT